MRPQRSYGSKVLSAKGRVRMAQSLVTNCREEKLSEMTAAWLADKWDIPVETAERMLCRARAARGSTRRVEA
jgi:hypothetical protein